MKVKEKFYPNAVFGSQPKVLESINQEENSIAIYQRDILSLKNELSIAMQNEIAFKISGTVNEITLKLDDYFIEQLPQCQGLNQDIKSILNRFNVVTKAVSYHLLLSTVSTNMCKKFHTDINDLRLLCTYAGPGTLWVSEDNSNIEKQKRRRQEPSIQEEDIHQVNTGDVVILKGALHPEGNPILHRSPTVEETGEKRLLLRLDTNSSINF